MRIKEFSLQRYGPLLESGRCKLSAFNLFYGFNEDGKTLTIDALVKLLLGREARAFSAIDRVDELPEGYLILEHKGEELKLPEAGFLPDLLGINSEECRNVFIIRDSDLAVDRESVFYRKVAHRLTGLRSAEIAKIVEKLREQGQLTPGHDFQDTGPLKLKSNLRKAGRLIDLSRDLMDRLEQDGYDRVEHKLAVLERRLHEQELQLERLEEARKRELFEKGDRALQILEGALRKVAVVRRFNPADASEWQYHLDSLGAYREREEQLREALAREEALSRSAAVRLRDAAVAVEEQLQKKELLAARVEPLLKRWADLELSLQKKKSAGKGVFPGRAAVFSALLFLLSLAGLLLRPAWWLYLFMAGSGGMLLCYGWFQIGFLRKRAALAAVNSKLCFEAAGIGFSAAGPVELRATLAGFEHSLAEAKRQLDEVDKEAAIRKDIGERITLELDELLRKVVQTRHLLMLLKDKSHVDTIGSYREKLRLKQELENKISRQKAVLESHFGDAGAGADLEGAIAAWRKDLSNYLPFRHKATGCSYSEGQVAALKNERAGLVEKKERLAGRLDQYRSELHSVEKEINEIFTLFGRSYFSCQTALELQKAVVELECWISEQEEKKEAAAAAIKIFDDIKLGEETKIGELFGGENSANDCYHRITGGRYREVLFDSEHQELMVRCADGSFMAASKLSGGAYDQLYFAIRLALGEKLLCNEKGFFILDDPFVKADPHRLLVQLQMLKTVVSRGWQVLYFSAKGEVKEALQEEINRGLVSLFTVAG